MTDSERYRKLETLFHEWVDLDEASRLARLHRLANEDPEMHSALAALMGKSSAVRAAEAALESLADTARAIAGPAPQLEAIGPYRVLRKIGEGGMGQVFEAEQLAPIQRHVAIKLARAGLADLRAMARFDAERQALAMLDHPNIARIFDAGTHSDGRPWFAMELVDGINITEWLEANPLGLHARIELLLPVLDAVQHAHQKGIIHRDLKPSNILVSTLNGYPTPRVIDFGIAKSLVMLNNETLRAYTQSGELVGTPEYMSPEQASIGAVDIDTRSDVYALGLVLFELLVGQLPMTLIDLRRLAFDEMCRRIREDDAPPPSRIAVTSVGKIVALASPRSSMPSAEWAKKIRGDLDAVVLKALAKDRDQRYASVADFAADLRRFLGNQPVLASPPHWRYRLRKWSQRNRALAAAIAVAFAGIAIGSAFAVDGYLSAQHQARVAVAAQAEAEATSEFMLGLFKAADPRSEPGQIPSARDLLARGVEALKDPEKSATLALNVRMRALENLGDASHALGDFAGAEELLNEALALRQAESPPQALRLAFVLDRLGVLARDRSDLPQALLKHHASLRVLREAGLARTLDAARAQNNAAIALRRSGRLAEAAEAYTELISLTRALETPPGAKLAGALLNFAAVQTNLGQPQQALANQLEALAIFKRVLAPDHPDFSIIYNNLAVVARGMGDLHTALKYIRLARANENANLPAQHADRADSLHGEAAIALRLGDLVGAEALLKAGRSLLTESLGADTPRLWVHIDSSAEIMLLQGDFISASREFAALLARMPDTVENAKQRLVTQRKLAIAQRGAGDLSAAALSAERYLAIALTRERPADQALAYLLLALIDLDARKADQAQANFEKALVLDPQCEHGSCGLDKADTHLLRAHYLAKTGQSVAAIASLEYAIAHPGWNATLLQSADLHALHRLPPWPMLQAMLRARVNPDLSASNQP